jgi:hypothetical protein
MRVTALRYERIARLGRFENQKLGVEVTLDEGDKPAAALRRAKRFVFRGLGLQLPAELLRADDDGGQAAPTSPATTPAATAGTPSAQSAATQPKPEPLLPADLEDWTNRMVELGAAQQVPREKVLKSIDKAVKVTGRRRLTEMTKAWLTEREAAANDKRFDWETGALIRNVAA